MGAVRLNVVCFTLVEADPSAGIIKLLLDRLRDSGEVFLTPTLYAGTAGMRAAFSNWRTEPADVERVWRALQEAAVTS